MCYLLKKTGNDCGNERLKRGSYQDKLIGIASWANIPVKFYESVIIGDEATLLIIIIGEELEIVMGGVINR